VTAERDALAARVQPSGFALAERLRTGSELMFGGAGASFVADPGDACACDFCTTSERAA
jgi:hypothetical protein